MGKSSSAKQQITDYYASVHFGIASEVDELIEIQVDSKIAWNGSATTQTTIDIDKPDLNGGIKKSGGLVGTVWWLPGAADQVMPEELARRLGRTSDTCPGFRGLSSMFFTGSGSNAGFLWSSNDPMIAQTVWAKVRRTPKGLDPTTATIEQTITTVTVSHTESDGTVTTSTFVQGTDSGIQTFVGDTSSSQDVTIKGANGAHIVYEALTNIDWGMGAPASAVNATSFQTAATTLAGEGLALSLMWSQQSTIEDFVNEILNHIQGVLFLDPTTGELTLTLIRNDYDASTLDTFTPDNAKMSNFQRKLWGDTINEMQVTYTDPLNEQGVTVTVQDLANIAIQGGVVSDTRNYYGVRTAALATQLAARDLRSAAAPLRSMEMEVDRSAWNKTPGQVVKVTWPEYRLNQVLMRIGKVDYGKPGDMAVKISMLEDVFALEQGNFTPAPASAWVDPSKPPQPITAAEVFTLPSFFGLTGSLQSRTVDLSYPEVLATVLAYENDRDTISFDLWTPQTGASGVTAYASVGTKTITERGLLGGLPAEAVSTLDLTVVPHISRGPQVGGFAFIGSGDASEIALVTAVGGTNFTLARGVLDTVPLPWPANTPIWFVNPGARVVDDVVVRSAGETVDYKILTQTSQGKLALGDSAVYSASLSDRPYRPLRPANVQINGIGFGTVDVSSVTDIAITWVNRNRTMEEGLAVLWTDASVTPEYRQQTIVTIKDDASGAVVYEQTGLWTETSLTLPKADFDHYGGIFITVSSQREGLDSLQSYTLHVTGLANNPAAPLPPAPPTPGDPPSPIPAPVAGVWTVTGTALTDDTGNSTPAIKISGTPSDKPDAEALVVRYKLTADTDWSTWPTIALNDVAIAFYVTGLEGRTTYDIEIAYVTDYGVDGAVLSAYQSYGSVTTGANVVSPGRPMVAAEALAAGVLVNVTTAGGLAKAQNANAGNFLAGTAKPARGFVRVAWALGETAMVYFTGAVNDALTGLTPGATYYLGANGAITLTPSTTEGSADGQQEVGFAVSATELVFDPKDMFKL